MYKWNFEINSPKNNYIRNLSNIPSNDIWISEHSNHFGGYWMMFSSVHLNNLDDPNEVYQKAFNLKLLLDGISYIIHENKNEYSQIILGNLFNQNNEKVSFDYIINSYPFDFSFEAEVTNYHYKQHPISYLIHLASSHIFIRNILLMCSGGMDYKSLYQVLDEIKYFLKGKSKLETLGINSKQLDRFTHTANNFETLGIEARHGSNDNKPHKNPMPLHEAQTFITQILRIIFKKYYDIDLPNIPEIIFSDDDFFD